MGIRTFNGEIIIFFSIPVCPVVGIGAAERPIT